MFAIADRNMEYIRKMSVNILIFISIAAFAGVGFVAAQNASSATPEGINVTRDDILKILFDSYNIHERPSEIKQTEVSVYMKVLAINSVDVLKMEYSTDVLLRQEWLDERLTWETIPRFASYNKSIGSPSLKDSVWLPDLFFRNGKKGYVHSMTLPNYLMRLNSNGMLLYSQKITMRFSCQMNLSTFPMDSQECIMDIGSYGYTLDQLKFVWRQKEPIIIADNIQIPEFNPSTDPTTFDCSREAGTSTGNYTCLKASFHLRRQLGSYLASTYIPNVLIVMVSWLNFWVSVEAIPARITLGLLTLLGILTQATGMSNSLPRVSYIKAIDIWIIACIIFVIGALIEFAMASMIARRRKSEDWQKQVREIVRQELARWCAVCQQQQLVQIQNSSCITDRTQFETPIGTEDLENLLCPDTVQKWKKKPTAKVNRSKPQKSVDSEIDCYSRFLFPACFVLYNCFYWLYYLVLVHAT